MLFQNAESASGQASSPGARKGSCCSSACSRLSKTPLHSTERRQRYIRSPASVYRRLNVSDRALLCPHSELYTSRTVTPCWVREFCNSCSSLTADVMSRTVSLLCYMV
ncbi:hypothetical protein TRVL_10334 [Trypanosoma vivax]|nr:hypothetical protein TRVL_10334 [Trypanosoma vivax]